MPWLKNQTFLVLCFVGSFNISAQITSPEELSEMEDMLSVIDSLLSEDMDSLARVSLDKLDPNDFQNSRKLLIRYHKYNGEYFLQTSKYAESVKAYEPLPEISSDNLDKKMTLELARAINDLGIVYFKVGSFEKAKNAHFQSLVLYDRFNDPQGGSYNYNNLALIYKERKQPDSAIYFHNKSLECAKLANDTLGVGFNLMNLAILFTDNKQFVKGLDHFHQSLDVFRELGNEGMMNAVRRRLGGYYMKIQDFESSKPLLLEVLKYYEKSKRANQIGVAHNRMAELYHRLHQYDSMLYHANAGLEALIPTNYAKGISSSYFLLGSYYAEVEDYQKARENLERSLKISDKRSSEAISTWGLLASIDLKENNPSQALIHLNRSFEQIERGKNEGSFLHIYLTLSKAHKLLGNADKSLFYLEKHHSLKAKMLTDEKRWEIARIEYRNFLEREQAIQKADRERQEVEYAQNLRNQRLTTYAAVTVLIFVGIVALLYYRSYRIKRTANQFLEEKNSALKGLREKENQLANEKIASKERELATMAMATHEKNNILNDLKAKIDVIGSKTSTESDLKDIKRSINNSLSLDDSWDSFLHRFEDVHPQFFDQLKAKNQNLTINDLKLSAYLKIGMNNKEIANVTFLTLGSVKSQINRLKKKLQLGPEDNIRDFMLQSA